MKKKALFLSLLFTPFLLANSPAPFSHPSSYDDYSVSNISYEASIDYSWMNVFSLTLENTGEGYICIPMSSLSIYIDEQNANFFNEYYYFTIAPGAFLDLKGRVDSNETDLSKITVKNVCGFQTFRHFEFTAKYSKYEIYEEDPVENDHKEVHYYYEFDFTSPKDYHYSYIIEYSVNGIPYSYYHYGESTLFDIVAFEEVDPSQIEITGLVGIEGRYKSGSIGAYIVFAIVGLALLFSLIAVAIFATIIVALGVAAKTTTTIATAAVVTPVVINKEKKDEQKLNDSDEKKDD